MGDLSPRGLHEGDLVGGSFTGDPKRYVKEIYQERCNNALYVSICLHRGPVGEPEGDALAGSF